MKNSSSIENSEEKITSSLVDSLGKIEQSLLDRLSSLESLIQSPILPDSDPKLDDLQKDLSSTKGKIEEFSDRFKKLQLAVDEIKSGLDKNNGDSESAPPFLPEQKDASTPEPALPEESSEELTEENNIILAGKKLRQMGPESVIIKKGAHGAILFHEDGMFALPAFPVTELRDPTGAGDSFAGALMGRLSSKNRHDFHSIKEAMVYATCTASLTVEAFGCDRLESAGVEAIKERTEKLLQLISID